MTAARITELFPHGVPPAVEDTHVEEAIPSPNEPFRVANVLAEELTEDGHVLLRRWRGDWWSYRGPHYARVEGEALRKRLYERLGEAQYEKLNTKTDQLEMKPWAPDKGKLDRVLDALTGPCLIAEDIEAPTWLRSRQPARGVVPCLNGLVDVDTQEVHPTTPDLFTTTCIPFEFDPHAGEPEEWLRFLRSLWPTEDGTDAEEITTVRQWFAYVLSGRLDLQKMLLLIGPPRSGKSTIARILTELIGKANVAAPTLAGLASNFGMGPLIGKTLGIVGDARLASQGQEAVVERLLSISGQDTIQVDRKNRDPWNGTMTARMMVLSNELPKFLDASGAIASRFVVVKLEQSFLGREDPDLEDRLRAELPAILKWALDGTASLNAAGRLHETARHRETMQDLVDLVSPISGFLRDVCDETDPDATVPFADLYRAYTEWCRENGRGQKNTAGFSSDLKSQRPMLKTDHRPKVEGRKLPRHVRGVTVGTEWRTRVKDSDPWAAEEGESPWRRSGGRKMNT